MKKKFETIYSPICNAIKFLGILNTMFYPLPKLNTTLTLQHI